ncbi:MAG: NAD(P)(+) transhydrogenase (Re/Si-specific) subunit beta [Leptospirales bacterium]
MPNILTEAWFRDLIYLVSVIFFVIGLKKLGSPRTARKGNLLSAFGMFLAIAITLANNEIIDWKLYTAGIVIGGLIGIIMAKKVAMTSMPEMVAIFNGFGGIASTLVAIAEYYEQTASFAEAAVNVGSTGSVGFEGNMIIYVTMILSVLVGLVTFSGSFIAFGKLAEFLPTKPILFFGQQLLNAAMFIGIIALTIFLFNEPSNEMYFWAIVGVSFFIGITLTIPIGGADMPVVVSLLNSYSGIAVAMTGFVLSNNALVIVGSLVGASGIILTMIMCKAMNRSLANVIFGGFGAETSGGGEEGGFQGTVKSMSPDEAGMILDQAESVIFVPGYGMAVSQAQHAVKELTDQLEERGIDVKFAIHPVAGRMPGHMNVLLAEAGIDYEKLYDMDINKHFSKTNVAIVIGANDVVNPAAKTNKSSPIYGMPVLNVEEAQQVFVLKRSMKPGFAGIENELFFKDNTTMIFGDAKKTIEGFISSLEELD